MPPKALKPIHITASGPMFIMVWRELAGGIAQKPRRTSPGKARLRASRNPDGFITLEPPPRIERHSNSGGYGFFFGGVTVDGTTLGVGSGGSAPIGTSQISIVGLSLFPPSIVTIRPTSMSRVTTR